MLKYIELQALFKIGDIGQRDFLKAAYTQVEISARDRIWLSERRPQI